MNLKGLFLGLFISILSTLIFLLVCEFFLRSTNFVSTPSRMQPVDPTSPISHFEPNREFIYAKGWNSSIYAENKVNDYGFNTIINFKNLPKKNRIALIGDSYIEAQHINKGKNVAEILNKKNINIFPIGISGAPLSQYIAFYKFAKNNLNVEKFIFFIVSNDFYDSFLDVKGAPGHHYFDYSNNMELVLVNYKPSLFKIFIRESALVNYFYRQLEFKGIYRKIFDNNDKRYQKNTYNNIDQKKEKRSKEAIDEFINYISINSNSNDILFVLDADRISIYDNLKINEEKLQSKLFKYFQEYAKLKGIKVLNLDNYYVQDYKKNKKKFNFENDYHLNEYGHNFIAEILYKEYFNQN